MQSLYWRREREQDSVERGESKLHAKIDQKPMYMHMMDKMQAFSSVELFIVTGDEKIIEEAEKRALCCEK